jgi:hypothetical protein
MQGTNGQSTKNGPPRDTGNIGCKAQNGQTTKNGPPRDTGNIGYKARTGNQLRMDHQETQATLDVRHRTNTNKTEN